MMLQSAGRSRERILLFGAQGVGKSFAALDIAARVRPQTMWVVDNDNAWERMLEGQTLSGEEVQVHEEWYWRDGKWEQDDRWCVEGGSVVIFHATDWESNASAIQQVMDRADRDDWCCIDSGTALWGDIQDWFAQEVWGTSLDDYFLQIRLEKEAAKNTDKNLSAFDGWTDWSVINAQYKGKVMKWLVTPTCHLIVVAEQELISREADKETRLLYSTHGVKPRGQKRLGHNVQTVLLLSKDRGGEFYAETVKDRGGRVEFEREAVTGKGFAEWYLEEVAGWQDVQSGAGTGSSSKSSSPASASPKPKSSIKPKGSSK